MNIFGMRGLSVLKDINIFGALSIFIAIFSLILGFYVFSKDEKGRLNKIFLFLTISLFLWIAGSSSLYFAKTEEEIFLFNNISAIGYCTIWSIVIHFLFNILNIDLLLKDNLKKKEKQKLTRMFFLIIVSYIVSFFFLFCIWSGTEILALGYEKNNAWYHGWVDKPNKEHWLFWLYTAAVIIWIIICFCLVVYLIKKAKNIKNKNYQKQIRLIAIPGVFSMLFAVFFNHGLQIFNIEAPSLGSIFMVIWLVFNGYAITKYKFLVPMLDYASKQMIDNSGEMNIVTDMELDITEPNRRFVKTLEYSSKRQTIGINFNSLLYDEKDAICLFDLEKNGFIEKETSVVSKSGKRVYINLKASFLKNNNIPFGVSFSLSNITQLKTQNKILDERVKEKTRELNVANEILEKQLEINRVYAGVSVDNFIKRGIDPRDIKPEEKEICILFSDIRNFSKISNAFSKEETVRLLNSVFNITDSFICGEETGEIDNRQGDSVFARFENSIDSLNAAINIRKGMIKLNQDRIVSTRLDVGIGIHSGYVMLANVGSPKKFNFTAIGDSVNCASRLEALTKCYGVSVIVSGELMDRVPSDIYQSRYLDEVVLPGRKDLIRLYEIYDHERDDIIEMKNKSKDLMLEANHHRKNGKFKEALKIYNALKKEVGPHKYDLETNISADPFIDFNIKICEGLKRNQSFDNFDFVSGICYFKK